MSRISARLIATLLALAALTFSTVHTQTRQSRPRLREHYRGLPVAEGEVLVRFRSSGRAPEEVTRNVDVDGDQPVGQHGWRRVHSASRDVQTLVTSLSA